MKVIGRILRYLLCLILFVLLLDVGSYLGVPVYRFAEGSSFSGDSIYDPYREVDSSCWRKANFHAHQRERKYESYTPDQFFAAYRAQGYDIIGLSDHCYLNYAQSDRAGFIPTYEFGWGINKAHFLMMGASFASLHDFPFTLTPSQLQHTLRRLNPQARVVVLNHPGQLRGIDHKVYERLRGYDLLEINPDNGRENSIPCWDRALSSGIYANLIGDDDAHTVSFRGSFFQRCFTMVNTPEVNEYHILSSLKKGKAYAVRLTPELNQRARPHEGLPSIRTVGLRDGGEVYLALSEPAREIRFVGQDGIIRKTTENVAEASYDFTPTDTYIRVEALFDSGVEIFTNPFVRTAGMQPVNVFIPDVHWPFTILLNLLWVFVFFVLCYCIAVLLRLLPRRWRPDWVPTVLWGR